MSKRGITRDHGCDPARLARSLTEDPDVVNESLFGFHVKRGGTDLDVFVHAVENNYINWDINDGKFQTLFFKIFKAPSGADVEVMAEVLMKTLSLEKRHSQDPALVKALIDFTQKQLRAYKTHQMNKLQAQPQSSQIPSKIPSSGKVQMKNGAMFDAAVIIDGSKHVSLNPNLLWLGVDGPKKGRVMVANGRGSRGMYRMRILTELYQFHGVVRKPKYFGRSAGGGRKWRSSSFKDYMYQALYHVVTVRKDNVQSIL